jgi:hypothetical protein
MPTSSGLLSGSCLHNILVVSFGFYLTAPWNSGNVFKYCAATIPLSFRTCVRSRSRGKWAVIMASTLVCHFPYINPLTNDSVINTTNSHWPSPLLPPGSPSICENHDPRVKWASKCDPINNGSILYIWRLIVHVNRVTTYFNYLEKIRNSTITIIPLYSSLNLYNCLWVCEKKELHVNEFPSYSLVKGKTVCL